MRQLALGFAVLVGSVQFSLAQTSVKDVTLVFNHVSDNYGVVLDEQYTYRNWNDVKVNFNRCQFYVSEMTLIHNNGTEIDLVDEYLLADYNTSEYDLGQHDMGELESIRFHVGVPQSVNHLDPTTYPAEHPLAPKDPTMHWGWDAGYRFIAIEGLIDRDDDDVVERIFNYHAVGDALYTEVNVSTAGVESMNELVIYINMDYRELMRDIDMQRYPFSHGEDERVQQMMTNVRGGIVFSAADGPAPPPPPPDTTSNGNTSVNVTRLQEQLPTVFPNPFNHQAQISYDFKENKNVNLVIADLSGRIIEQYNNLPNTGRQTITMDEPEGVYMFYFQAGEDILYQDKLVLLR